MPFFVRQTIGRIYVIKIVLPESFTVYKIGMCNSDRSTDRMMEILRSWFVNYRFVPYTELKLDMKCDNAGKLEKYLHKVFQIFEFEPNYPVQGHTEMFTGLNEQRLLWFIKAANESNFSEYPVVSLDSSKHLYNLFKE